MRGTDLYQFYAWQCYLLDEGRAEEWARTFIEDGSFLSPTYEQPAVGYSELVKIGHAYITGGASRGVRNRHIATNLWACVESDIQKVRGYFTVVASGSDGADIARQTQFEDSITTDSGAIRVISRVVHVDGGIPPMMTPG